MTLHILTKTQSRSSNWSTCEAALADGDVVLLSCDAVYDFHRLQQDSDHTRYAIYALKQDADKRGVKIKAEYLQDFADFVRLTEDHQAIQSW